MVGLFLSGNNDENFYRNNNSASSADVIISQDARHNNNGDKPLARLLIVDDEYDIVQVLKLGAFDFRSPRFLRSMYDTAPKAIDEKEIIIISSIIWSSAAVWLSASDAVW